MLRTRLPTAHHLTISIFGCQRRSHAPDADRDSRIDQFDSLVKSGAAAVEELEQNDTPTRIWMSYWASPQTFKAWWESPAVSGFWGALPADDAGFWRETVSLPATRAMFETSQASPTVGWAHVSEPIPLTEKFGYWGAYRDRLTPAEPGDKFASPLAGACPQPRPLTDAIRPGRVRMVALPDNMCFTVEAQDYGRMSSGERDYWDENFDALAKQWVTNVVTGGPEKGMVSIRACHVPSDDASPDGINSSADTPHDVANGPSIFPGLDHSSQMQLMFYLDMAAMEHQARWDKVHVQLRRSFMEAYLPGGPMHGGDLHLWVGVGVLKGDEIDAEYVGCRDGTGFMAYDDHPSFRSETQSVPYTRLPAFFDKPIPSKPIEW